MTAFRIQRLTPLSADEAWQRLTDWPRHAAHVPLTTITLTETGFAARTGIGWLAFDDPMDVVSWAPPAHCRLEKRGRFVTGWAEIDVRAAGSGSEVVWTEDLRLRILPSLFDRPTAWAGRLMFGRAIRALLS